MDRTSLRDTKANTEVPQPSKAARYDLVDRMEALIYASVDVGGNEANFWYLRSTSFAGGN